MPLKFVNEDAIFLRIPFFLELNTLCAALTSLCLLAKQLKWSNYAIMLTSSPCCPHALQQQKKLPLLLLEAAQVQLKLYRQTSPFKKNTQKTAHLFMALMLSS